MPIFFRNLLCEIFFPKNDYIFNTNNNIRFSNLVLEIKLFNFIFAKSVVALTIVPCENIKFKKYTVNIKYGGKMD